VIKNLFPPSTARSADAVHRFYYQPVFGTCGPYRNVSGYILNARFQEAIIVGCTPKRWESSAVVCSFFKAASATLALNALTFVAHVSSFQFRLT